MTLHQSDAALAFLTVLQREFPDDPDALYVAVHAYSDLSTEASQALARNASSSFQAHELLAESYESQSKWGEAEKEYRGIVAQNPKLPGIHFRIGRLLLSKPNPPADVVDEARREFTEELTIDPSNAAAEYVLGELARQDQSWDDAIAHFSKAGKLDPQFSEAFLGTRCFLHRDQALRRCNSAARNRRQTRAAQSKLPLPAGHGLHARGPQRRGPEGVCHPPAADRNPGRRAPRT